MKTNIAVFLSIFFVFLIYGCLTGANTELPGPTKAPAPAQLPTREPEAVNLPPGGADSGGKPPEDQAEEPADWIWFGEDWEQGLDGTYPWRSSGDAAVITAEDEGILPADRPFFGNSSRFLRMSVGRGQRADIELSVTIPRDGFLSFKFKTDLSEIDGQFFKVLVDGVESASFSGLYRVWREGGVPVPAGSHDIQFLVCRSDTIITNRTNSVYLDGISLVADTVHHVSVTPPGRKETFVGAAPGDRLVFFPLAKRFDDSIISAKPEDFSLILVSPDGLSYGDGIVSSEGVLMPLTPGEYKILASYKGRHSALSDPIVVHDRNYMKDSYHYPGTGLTYQGNSGSCGKEDGEPLTYRSLIITCPTESEFLADAFFTLQGTINNPACLDHALLKVTKVDDRGEITAAKEYYLNGNVNTRIWLRHGQGAYRVELFHLKSIKIARGLGADGFVSSSTYEANPGISFTVTNTRDEDGSFIYPTPEVQADDLRIMNLAAEITYGCGTKWDKIVAIHDKVISLLRYDFVALIDENTVAKSNAVVTLKRGMGQCEDYTHLSTALLRAAGIPTREVFWKRDSGSHAYNYVYLGGVPLLFDATHDDPPPDDDQPFRTLYTHLLKRVDPDPDEKDY
jgi:hypothetical protein